MKTKELTVLNFNSLRIILYILCGMDGILLRWNILGQWGFIPTYIRQINQTFFNEGVNYISPQHKYGCSPLDLKMFRRACYYGGGPQGIADI